MRKNEFSLLTINFVGRIENRKKEYIRKFHEVLDYEKYLNLLCNRIYKFVNPA